MKQKSSSAILLLAAYIGTVVGVGIYNLPYVLERSGIVIFSLFVIGIGFVVYIVNALFADVVLRSDSSKRFLGYVKAYVGHGAEKLFFLITIFGFWGSFLIYLIVWGKFATLILSPLLPYPPLVYSLILFLVTLFIACTKARTIEWLDIVMLVGVSGLFIVLAVSGIPHMRELPVSAKSAFDGLMPYGALVFALWGVGIIPEIVDQAKKDRKKVQRILFWGVVITACVYILFASVVVSISGIGTTKEAIAGLAGTLGRPAVAIGSLIGMVTIFLSYNNLAWVSRSMLMHDYGFDRFKTLAVIFLPPLVLLLFGITNITLIISINGAVLLGLQGIMILVLYVKSRKSLPKQNGLFVRPIPHSIAYVAMAVLSIGILFDLIKTLLENFG